MKEKKHMYLPNEGAKFNHL